MRILIKGAGDLATGIACRLHRCGYEILMTDIAVPTAVRRTVSFSRAIYEGRAVIEGIEAVYVGSIDDICGLTFEMISDERLTETSDKTVSDEAVRTAENKGSDFIVRSMEDMRIKIDNVTASGKIAVIVDPDAAIAKVYKPDVIVDAIIAKKNLGTSITDAPLVIGVGPGFTAGTDCHCVVETKRGHYLGKVMHTGSAIPNTGVPGDIGGFTTERIIRATADGVFVPVKQIGDRVEAGDIIAEILRNENDCSEIPGQNLSSQDDNKDFPETTLKDRSKEVTEPIFAQIPGIIRGMLQADVPVYKGMKCGDIDPRCEQEHCYTVSDKARAIGGGVLEAIAGFEHKRNSTGIVLLAAGEGKRYGSNKLLDTINGSRMFEKAVDAAAGAIESMAASTGLVIVTGYDEIEKYASEKGFTVVRNNRPELGISESLKLGIKEMVEDNKGNEVGSILFAVCDQPGLTADSFRRLIDGYSASDKGLACMGQGENMLGNPCIFSKAYFDELNSLTGDTGGKRVIMAHKDDLKVIYATDLELADIDTKR